MRKTSFVVAVAGVLAASAGLGLAQDAITRKPLQKSDYPGDHASHLMFITVIPGGIVPRHTHPGIEMGYVEEGELTLVIEGQPEMKLKAGDSYAVPPGAIHGGKNTGTTPVKIVGTFVVDKSKPLASPAP